MWFFPIWTIVYIEPNSKCFSERCRIGHGVPQGSILGPLFFNIDLIDLFYECEGSNIASYADDTTLLAQGTPKQ